MPENLGFIARAMKNFGLRELRIVNPQFDLPNELANAVAVAASHIVSDARIFTNIEAATKDINIIYAATARSRFMNKPSMQAEEMAAEYKNYVNLKVAIIFGPERSGLPNDIISIANKTLHIPVNPEFPSLNLSHAATIVIYEWYKTHNQNIQLKNNYKNIELATNEEISHLFNHLENELYKKEFFAKIEEKAPKMVYNIRNIFKRIENLTSQDVRTLRGIIRSLSK